MAYRSYRLVLALAMLLALAGSTLAGPTGRIGPYKVEIATDPAVIPVDRANVLLLVTDESGQPVSDASIRALVKMPTMDMGEVETTAKPVEGRPGVYTTPAVFAMEGPYVAILKITGPAGAGTGEIPLETGMDTGGDVGGAGGGPSPLLRVLPWLFAAALVVFVAYRMKRTGQQFNWRAAWHWQFIAGMAVLIAMFAVSWYAVKNWRRPGAMTPIEAQAMEMNTPAPPGVAAVRLAEVTSGAVRSTVRYTGQAVGYEQQDVYPRVRGWITWMPFYTGDRVKKGQVLARLDTSEIEPQVAEREAMANMAEQGASVARGEYRQMLEEVNEASAELAGKQSGVREAQAGLRAARAEQAEAEARQVAARTMVADAEADLDAARADNTYWQKQVERTRALQKQGVVSGEELQRETAQAETAAAKMRQAQARLNRVNAEVRMAESGIRRAEAMVASATAKVSQASSELSAGRAQVRTAQAAASAARDRIGQAAAGVEQARAAVAATETQRGYSEIRSLIDGVITKRLISPGVLVNPGQAILQVAQVSPIRLQANVAEADLQRIRPGSPVSIRGKSGGPAVTGKVTSVEPGVDPATRTGVVEAVVQNKNQAFLPGEYVVMEITTGRSAQTLRVPTPAIQWRTSASGGVQSTESRPYVWVAEPDSGKDGQYTVRRVTVQAGLSGNGFTEITAGLEEGWQVVTSGYQYLRDGDTVTPASEESPRTAEAAMPAGHQHEGGSE